jgi:hypothetical protein
MRELAAHYGHMRPMHPQDTLLFVFDADGTIIDVLTGEGINRFSAGWLTGGKRRSRAKRIRENSWMGPTSLR